MPLFTTESTTSELLPLETAPDFRENQELQLMDSQQDLYVAAITKSFENLISLRRQTTSRSDDFFSLIELPKISIHEYLLRLLTFGLKLEILIMANCLIDRYLGVTSYSLTNFNVYHLVAVATCIAHKMHCDDYFPQIFLARLYGIKCDELSRLEIKFAESIRWNIQINKNIFNLYKYAIEKKIDHMTCSQESEKKELVPKPA